jgi:CHASE2 domain-containing sensor protein
MNAIWGLAVGQIILVLIAAGVLATSLRMPPSSGEGHARLKVCATALAGLSAAGLVVILLFRGLLVGVEDFLFAVFPSLLVLVLCGVVVWRSHRVHEQQARV